MRPAGRRLGNQPTAAAVIFAAFFNVGALLHAYTVLASQQRASTRQRGFPVCDGNVWHFACS